MKLSDLYPKLSAAEREALAGAVNVTPTYLRLLAQGHKRNPSLRLMQALAVADPRLKVQHLVVEFTAPPPAPVTAPGASEAVAT